MPVLVKYHHFHFHSSDKFHVWLSTCHILVLHLVPPFSGLRFFFVCLFLHQLYNWTMQFMQCKLLFLFLSSPFNIVWTLSLLRTHLGKMCLCRFHLRHISFNFRWCETEIWFFYLLSYLLQLIVTTSLFTSPLSSWYTKRMPLYREMGACQSADCRYRAWACQSRMILIH